LLIFYHRFVLRATKFCAGSSLQLAEIGETRVSGQRRLRLFRMDPAASGTARERKAFPVFRS